MHVCLAVVLFPLFLCTLRGLCCTGNKYGALIPVLIGTQYIRRASTQKKKRGTQYMGAALGLKI